jgi:hypothetical protein
MSNTRFITAIIAFVATFIFSAGLVRIIFGTPEAVTGGTYHRTHCFSRQARGIENFIWQDVRNGESRMEKIGHDGGLNITPSSIYFTDFAVAVMEYSNVSGSMNDSSLPDDLREAWREHMNAWRDFAIFLDETKNLRRGERMDTEDFKAAERRYNSEINRTWINVLRIATDYGANVY